MAMNIEGIVLTYVSLFPREVLILIDCTCKYEFLFFTAAWTQVIRAVCSKKFPFLALPNFRYQHFYYSRSVTRSTRKYACLQGKGFHMVGIDHHGVQVRRFKKAIQTLPIGCGAFLCNHFVTTIPAPASYCKKLFGGYTKRLYFLLVAFSKTGSMSSCTYQCCNYFSEFYTF